MRRTCLSVDGLERRDVPAQFGIPWANGTALTVSFAPDGADVDGSASQLNAVMARSGLSPAVWQRAILRAFQAWSSRADLNIGRVSDDGSPIGEAGRPQAEARFGDIRIFAAPLSSGVLAITTPPGDLAGTRTGDIILNSNFNFGVGSPRDLYTVFLQEAGHALGVANSPNTSSVMYEFYQGTRTGLSAEDVGQVQALYGSRPARTWEPANGNNTASAATPLAGTGTRLAYGDMASAADADWYSFTAPSGGTMVRLQTSGLSLLAGRVAVYNTALTRVGLATASGTGQDLTRSLPNLRPGAKYFIRVDEAAGTPFATGQYTLLVTGPSPGTPVVTLGGQPPVDDAGTNESFLSATRLDNIGVNGASAFRTFAHLRSGDVDVYKVRSPFPGMNQANVLTATVRAFGPLAPEITVSNALGLAMSAQVTADGNGLYTVVQNNAAPNADYLLTVRSRSGAAGDYELRAGFRSVVTTPHEVASGLLTTLNPSTKGTIEVIGSAQLYFRLDSALTPVVGPSVTVKVYDAANRLRISLLARAGDTVDGVALLGPGRYRVEIAGNGDLLPFLTSAYKLSMALMTDPVGVRPADPNDPNPNEPTEPPPPPPSEYNYYNDSGYRTWGEKTPTSSG